MHVQDANGQKPKDKLLRGGLLTMLVLLVAQFSDGMYLNFFVKLPGNHPGTGGSYEPSIPWALSAHAGMALAIHVTGWLLLMVCGVALLVRSILSRHKAVIVRNVLGFLFILVATSGGLTFLNRGGDDKESMIMALGFILAFIVYGSTFYRTGGEHK